MTWKKGPMIEEFPTFICNTRFCVMFIPRRGAWFVVDLDDEYPDAGPYETADEAMEAFEIEIDDEDSPQVVVSTSS